MQYKIVTPRAGSLLTPEGQNLNNFDRGPLDDAYNILNIIALGLVVADKKIFASFILKPIY